MCQSYTSLCTNQRLRSFCLAVAPQKNETFKDHTTTILATASGSHKNKIKNILYKHVSSCNTGVGSLAESARGTRISSKLTTRSMACNGIFTHGWSLYSSVLLTFDRFRPMFLCRNLCMYSLASYNATYV